MEIHEIRSAVQEFSTPVYLYDGGEIRRQYGRLKDCFPERFDIFYSMKANPLLGICQMFKRLGSCIEVASAGELYTALAAGFPPGDILFTSPGKTREELDYAVKSGIHSINIESAEEALLLNEIALSHGRAADISLRINPDFDVSGAGIKMSGVPTQFGIDYTQVEDAMGVIRSLPGIRVIGIHVYTGTQALNPVNILRNMEEVIKMALEVSAANGFELKFLDLGGGFGIPYFHNENPLDLAHLKEGVQEIWGRYRSHLQDTRMAVESGRFLMAEAGIYLTKVLYRKETKGRQYLVCDGGSNHHANSAFLGRHIRNNFPMHILGKETDAEEVYIAGPLCTPTDIVGQKVTLPRAEPGDLLVVEKSGAYGLTHSPVLFLGHEQPAEVLLDNCGLLVLRERGRKDEQLLGQHSLQEDFHLLRWLTSERGRGTLVWMCNIGAERYWSGGSRGVSDRNEDAVVNRVEEMNLLLCRSQDVLILRQKPDPAFLEVLRNTGFSIPRILTPAETDALTPISELVLKDEALLEELKGVASEPGPVYFLPYAVTRQEEEIARKTGLSLMGASSEVCTAVNNKIFNREAALKLGFPVCEGTICGSVEEIREAYESLTQKEPFFEKVIVKEPAGASGKGLYIIESRERLESTLRLITRFSRGVTGSRWLVEGWYGQKSDLNYQAYISPSGEVEVFSIKQQLLRDTVYIGSKIPAEFDSSMLEAVKEYGERAGQYLYSMGYHGVAGIDAIIDKDRGLIPIIEINGRFTLSTYLSFIQAVFKDRKILSRYFRLITSEPLGYGDLLKVLEERGILYHPARGNGVFIYTAGTLPETRWEDATGCTGRVFALILASGWEQVESLSLRLEETLQSLSREQLLSRGS